MYLEKWNYLYLFRQIQKYKMEVKLPQQHFIQTNALNQQAQKITYKRAPVRNNLL
jgi:hypothetical protein